MATTGGKKGGKSKHNCVAFEAAAEVCGTSRLDRFYLSVGLVPCYPVGCLLPAFVNRGSLQAMSSWSVKTRRAPSRHCRDARVYDHRTTAMHDIDYPPPVPFRRASPTTDAWRCLFRSASSLCHLTMNRFAASRTPRYHLPAFFAATVHTGVSIPYTNGVCSVDPSVARNTLRSLQQGIGANHVVVRPFSGPPLLSSSQTSPDWAIAPCVAAPRPPQRRAYVYG